MTISAFLCKRCNVDRETPFCPVCGERLTENEFIGHNIQQLEHEYEEASREHRRATDRIRELERKHEADLKPMKESRAKWVAMCHKIDEAKDWARTHDIQHPGARRGE